MVEELLIAVVLILVGALLDRIIPRVFETIWSKIQKLRWKAYVSKEYQNRDLIVKMKQGSEVKVLGKKHEIGGFVVVSSMGELSYEFWLKRAREKLERWLEFAEDKIVLWGEWSDPDLWGYLGTKEKQPEPMTLKAIEGIGSPPIVKIGNLRATIIDRHPSAQIQVIWGKWGSHTATKKTLYNYVDAVVLMERKEVNVDGRKLLISLGAYSGHPMFTEFLVGNELRPDDIEVLD